MQRYAECYVKKEYRGKDAMLRIGLVIGCVLFGLGLALTAVIAIPAPIWSYLFGAVLFASSMLLLRALWKYVDAAYEYTIVEDELRVDRILGDVVRQHIVTILLRSVQEKGSLSDAGDLSGKRVYTALSAPDAEDAAYVCFADTDGADAVLLWNGREKMLSLMPWGKRT